MILLVLGLLFATTALAADYVIGEGDLLAIAVWGEKDFSLPLRVRPDGKITIPAVGELTAANMTAKDLQQLLTEKLGAILKKPVVSVAVTEITNNKIYIFGGGVSSRVYSLIQRTTLLQLLCQFGEQQPGAAGVVAAANGAQDADLKNAYVLRSGVKIKQNFYDLFIGGNIADDIVLEPKDVIFIPTYNDKNVYIMGAVTTPRSISYREGITIMEAILGAGGFTKFASLNDTVIFRKENNKEISIPVKMKRLMFDGDLTQNMKLKPGDYVVVKEGMF